jgi:LPS-assembly lipoprotein
MNSDRRPSRRLLLAGLGAVALGGCGFQPLYGERSALNAPAGQKPNVLVRDELAAVWIEPIPERMGQMLRNELIDKFNGTNEPAQPRYRLAISLRELKYPVLERRDVLETATNLVLLTTYRLKAPNGADITTNVSRVVVRFNQLDQPYATITAEEYARERAVREAAEDIRLRIALFLANQKGT